MAKVFKQTVKFAITLLVDFLAVAKHYRFPSKYNWRWKMDMLLEKYEPETTSAFKQHVKPGMAVIDIGAHIGYFTRLSAKLVGSSGRVLAFEPEPENFHLLESNVRRRGNVKIYNLALADKRGEMPFYKSTGKTGSHSLIADEARAEKITVKVDTLDNFLGENGIQKIDFIKMDIEGAEPLALQGMAETLKKNPGIKIIMEFCTEHLRTAGFDPLEVLRGFADQGFTVKSIDDNQVLSVTHEEISAIDAKVNSYINLLIFRP